MAISNKITIREYQKFRESNDGSTALAVVNPDGSSIGGTSSGSGGTVYQGTTPWLSLGTTTIGSMLPTGTNYVGLATVVVGNAGSIGGGTQYTEGDTDASITGTALMFEDININPDTLSVVSENSPLPVALSGFSNPLPVSTATIFAVVNTGSSNANVTLNPSPNFIGLATVVVASSPTIYAVVNTSAIGVQNSLTTLLSSDQWIGLISTASIQGKVAMLAGDGTPLNQSGGNLLVNVQNFAVGQFGANATTQNDLASALMMNENMVYDGTYWVRQLGNSTDGNLVNLGTNNDVILNSGTNFIGLATVVNGNQPALVASSAYIGLVSAASINGNVGLVTGTNFIGLATVVQGNQPALVASSAYIGLVSAASIQGKVSLVAGSAFIGLVSAASIQGNVGLVAGTNFVGLATVVNGNQPALVASSAFIGLATIVHGSAATVFQVPISTYTSLATVISASGNATIFVPPTSTRWVAKDLIINTQGSVMLSILSGANTVVPAMSLAAQSGFLHNFGDSGLRGKAVNDAFVVNLGSAATVAVFANVRFDS